MIEVNEEAKLENELLGYRGTSIGIKVVKEIIKQKMAARTDYFPISIPAL